MRLFVAVDLSPEAVEEAMRVAAEIRTRARVNLRWVPADNMHLTVRFIGHVADQVDALVATLSQPLHIAPFDLTLGACGAFPERGAVRVVWIGIDAGAPHLARISASMDERVRPFGFEPEPRGFSPHLTLARAQRNARVPRELRGALTHVIVRPVNTRVTQAVLYQSHLSPRGARYEPVVTIPLTGREQ